MDAIDHHRPRPQLLPNRQHEASHRAPVHGGSRSRSRLSRRTQVTARTAAAATATASPPRLDATKPPIRVAVREKTKTEFTRVASHEGVGRVRSGHPHFGAQSPTGPQYGHCPAPPPQRTPRRRPDQTRARVLIAPPWERGEGGDEDQEPPLHRFRAQAVCSLPSPPLPPPLAQARGRPPPRGIADEFLASSRCVVRWLSHARDLGSVRRLAAGICFSFVLIFFLGNAERIPLGEWEARFRASSEFACGISPIGSSVSFAVLKIWGSCGAVLK
jgi:hypothetical protein